MRLKSKNGGSGWWRGRRAKVDGQLQREVVPPVSKQKQAEPTNPSATTSDPFHAPQFVVSFFLLASMAFFGLLLVDWHCFGPLRLTPSCLSRGRFGCCWSSAVFIPCASCARLRSITFETFNRSRGPRYSSILGIALSVDLVVVSAM